MSPPQIYKNPNLNIFLFSIKAQDQQFNKDISSSASYDTKWVHIQNLNYTYNALLSKVLMSQYLLQMQVQPQKAT